MSFFERFTICLFLSLVGDAVYTYGPAITALGTILLIGPIMLAIILAAMSYALWR